MLEIAAAVGSRRISAFPYATQPQLSYNHNETYLFPGGNWHREIWFFLTNLATLRPPGLVLPVPIIHVSRS